SRIMLHHQFMPNLPAIEIDVGQLKQVVVTFYNEAVQNVPDKGGILTLITGQMNVDTEFCRKFDGFLIPKPGSYVFFEIHDTRSGMTEKEIVHLFDPYFRESGEQGLKLSIALNVIKNNNGFVTVNSLLAAGNSVRVYLPASTEAEVADPHFFQQALHGVDTILLVDNEQAILTILKTIFTKLGYSVFTANNGREAVDLFEQIYDDIDLVLLDLTMPVMNGIEALKKLREIDPAVRIIMFSGYDKSEMDRVPDVQGVEAFIEKPRLIDELNQQIMDLFGRK
ncbi:response regulator, partial [bacterium]|nr:response regulator [bacterium]